MTDNTAVSDPLDDWFRHIGVYLSRKDYEAGIQAIEAHDRALVAAERAPLRRLLEHFPTTVPADAIRQLVGNEEQR